VHHNQRSQDPCRGNGSLPLPREKEKKAFTAEEKAVSLLIFLGECFDGSGEEGDLIPLTPQSRSPLHPLQEKGIEKWIRRKEKSRSPVSSTEKGRGE